jgi:hypothetical protein
MNAPVTFPSSANTREWWAAESRRVGTDWISLIDAAQAVLCQLRVRHVGASLS